MIHFIKGVLVEITGDYVVIENSGLGYKVATSLSSIQQWQQAGETIVAHTEMIVREDSIGLVGFATKDELKMFQLLTSVSGVGTKVGVAILSALPIEKLAIAIQTGDVKTITAAPGVGKKTAERMVLELKDKVKAFGTHIEAEVAGQDMTSMDDTEDAMLALVALGYTKAEAQKALSKIGSGQKDTEQLIKEALKALMMQ